MPRYPLADWLAEQLRLTVFTAPGAIIPRPEQWWDAILATPAEQSSANLRSQQTTLAGSIDRRNWILRLEPGRIDWIVVPSPADDQVSAAGNAIPLMGSVAENLALFSRYIEAWLGRPDVPDLVRIAFGAILHHPEEDRRSAYVQLGQYLPFRLDPESSDFFLQINLPPTDSRTGVRGLRFNRLSRWSITAVANVGLRLEGPGPRVTASSSGFMAHAIRIELDINTAPEFQGTIPRDRFIDVYRELVTFGQNLVIDGLPQ
jgi:hypothetical protein